MALQTKVIKQKIKSVANVGKVTKTMELISVAKMKKAIELMQKSDTYGRSMLDILLRLSNQRQLDHPLLKKHSNGNRKVLILFTSDRGLCGQYHTRIDKKVRKFIEKNDGKTDNIECITVGKFGIKIANRYGLKIITSVEEKIEKINIDHIRKISREIVKLYQEDSELKEVDCIFNSFENAMQYQSVSAKLFPLDEDMFIELFNHPAGDEGFKYSSRNLYTLEPSEDEIVEKIIPELITAVLHQFLRSASASEHSSRMVAMRRASDNSKRLEEELVRDYNRARQESVTEEIIEIVNTASAV